MTKKPKLDENEYICPNGHRFRARFEKQGRLYCPKCYRSYTKNHLEKIKQKFAKSNKIRIDKP